MIISTENNESFNSSLSIFTHTYYSPILSRTAAAAAAKSLQLCPTLCDPIDSSPPGSPIPRDSQGKNTGMGPGLLVLCKLVLRGISTNSSSSLHFCLWAIVLIPI